MKLLSLCKKDVADNHDEIHGDRSEKNFVVPLPANPAHEMVIAVHCIFAAKRRYIIHLIPLKEMWIKFKKHSPSSSS